MATITVEEVKRKLAEVLEVLNAGPVSGDDPDDLWGYVDWLNTVISMGERNE